MIKAEVPLDMSDNLRQHLLGIIAGDGRLRNTVEKCELVRAPLFLGEQPRVFNSDRHLAGSGLQHIQIPLFEYVLARGAHRSHYAGRFPVYQDGRAAERLRRPARNKTHTQPLARAVQI